MTPKPIPFDITKGETFTMVVQWETDPTIFKAITAISKTAPVVLECIGHGMVNGRKAAITNALGMVEINATANNVRERDRHAVTVIDPDHLSMDIDATGFHTYTGGGVLQYQTPGDLAVYTKARDSFKRRAGVSDRLVCTVGGVAGTTKPTGAGTDGAVTWVATTNPTNTEWIAGATYAEDEVIDLECLLFCSTENGRLAVNDTTKEVSYLISANDVAAFEFRRGVHELEMVKPGATFVDDEVIKLIPVSDVTIHQEGTS